MGGPRCISMIVSSPSSSSSAATGFGRCSDFLGRPRPRLTGFGSGLTTRGFGLGTGAAVAGLDAVAAGFGGGGILVRCRLPCLSSWSCSGSSLSATLSSDDRFCPLKIDGMGRMGDFIGRCGSYDGAVAGDGLADGSSGSSGISSFPSAGGNSSSPVSKPPAVKLSLCMAFTSCKDCSTMSDIVGSFWPPRIGSVGKSASWSSV